MTPRQIERTQSAYGFPLIIRSLFRSGLAVNPAQEVIYADKKRMTFREFGERVGRLGSALSSLGVKPGNTVAVMDWDSHRYLECFFAVPMMGAVLHTVNVRLSAEQILYTINHANDDFILVNSEFLPLLEEIWHQVIPGKQLVLLNDTSEVPRTLFVFAGEYEALLVDSDPDFPFPELHEETQATTFYTTGTTGSPKSVYFSHRQLVLHTLALHWALSHSGTATFGADDVYMPITPMFHVHAWGMPYVATMLGAKQVYPGRYVPDSLCELYQRERVSFSHCVPTILKMVLNKAKERNTDLSGWKLIIGGAALPNALAKEACEAGVEVFSAYGMSETGPLLTVSRLKSHMLSWDLDRQIEMRCRTGLPVPLVQLRIVDDAMNDVPHDGESQGEIVARAPWLTQGYLKDPQSSERLWAGGWLHTGDIAVIGADGYVKITDRIKDVIKSGGEWVSSLDVEDLLLRHSAVAEAAVIGIPDPKWSERAMAIVVLRNGMIATDSEMRAHLRTFVAKGIISSYALPEKVVFVEELPRTSVGKIDKKELRRKFVE